MWFEVMGFRAGGPERNLETTLVQRWFYLGIGAGPVGRKSCTRTVKSDWLYTFRWGVG